MKTLTIGDLHGLPHWKKADPERYDLIIFLGDYLDSHQLDDQTILNNLKDIIHFRILHGNKVKLLLGNHEISYLHRWYRCDGYRIEIAAEVNELLMQNFKLFHVAYQFKNYLWTHAGIHQDFYERRILPVVQTSDINLAATLQRLFDNIYDPLFEVGPERGGWNRKAVGGPFWIDSNRLTTKPLKGFHQIVGHTSLKTVEHYRPYENDPGTSVTLCDCIEKGDGSFYELEIFINLKMRNNLVKYQK